MRRRGAIVAVTMKRGLEVRLVPVRLVGVLEKQVRAHDRAVRERGQKAQDRECSKDVTCGSHRAADHTSLIVSRKTWRLRSPTRHWRKPSAPLWKLRSESG